MIITQLSNNGFFATEVLPDTLLNELSDIAKKFELIDDIRGNGTPSCKREVSFLFKNTEINDQIIGILEPHIKLITPDYGIMYGLELWRDYPGYINPAHMDCPEAQNIMIVYLDDQNLENGTEYKENQETYKVSYEKNSALILLNSDKILHGMTGTVREGFMRHSLYVSWLTQDRKIELGVGIKKQDL
jgi:hypothetical protein